MRLLLVSHIFLPAARAGVETYGHELAGALAEGGAEVAVATTRKIISLPTGHLCEDSLDGLRIFEAINNLDHGDFSATYKNETMEAAFIEILERFRPDAVHFQHLMYWSLGLPAIARRLGLRVFLTLHDFWLMCPRLGQLVDWQGRLCRLPEPGRCAPCLEEFAWGQSQKARRWIKRLGLIRRLSGIPLDAPMRALENLRRGLSSARSVSSGQSPGPVDLEAWTALLDDRRREVVAMAADLDLLITPSRSLLARFEDWGLTAPRSLILPQGRRSAPFAGVAASRRPSPRLRAAFIGTVAPHKGVRELVEAASEFDPERFSLDIHGPFRQHADYERLCRAAAGPAVRFRGPADPLEVPRLYRHIDLLCVPSLWDECCPLTIQEAFMAGVPVLASDLGGMRDLLESGGGRLLPAGDVAAWRAEFAALVADDARLEGYRNSLPEVPEISEHAARLRELYSGGE